MNPSSTQPSSHRVYKAVLRPLTLCGLERRLFFGALMTGALIFHLSKSLVAGILVALSLYVAALLATKRDPQMLRIIFMATRLRSRYDPAKHAPVHIEVRSC